MLTLVRRAEIAQLVVDRFNDQALDWGTVDCLRVLASVVVEAGWPDPTKGLSYRTPMAAAAQLRRRRFTDLAQAVDKIFGFERVGVNSHLPADLLWFPNEEMPMGALGVCVGDNKALAFVDASLDPRTMARIRRRLAGFDHRLQRAAEAAAREQALSEEAGWPRFESLERITRQTASIEAKRAVIAGLPAWEEQPPVRGFIGSASVAQVCWRLACPQ